LDTVGGKSFGSHVEALRPGGVLSLVGAVGGSGVSFDAYRLLEITLTGYASDALDGAALRRAIGFMSGWLSKGAMRAPARSVFPSADAAAAHAKLEQRAIQGRVVLIPRR
jgi:NADPH2:quinone reductase